MVVFGGVFLFYLPIKQCVHVYMHVIFVLTLFVVKNFYVLEFNNYVCKFDKNKNKNLLKKKNSSEFLKSLFLARNYFM